MNKDLDVKGGPLLVNGKPRGKVYYSNFSTGEAEIMHIGGRTEIVKICGIWVQIEEKDSDENNENIIDLNAGVLWRPSDHPAWDVSRFFFPKLSGKIPENKKFHSGLCSSIESVSCWDPGPGSYNMTVSRVATIHFDGDYPAYVKIQQNNIKDQKVLKKNRELPRTISCEGDF